MASTVPFLHAHRALPLAGRKTNPRQLSPSVRRLRAATTTSFNKSQTTQGERPLQANDFLGNPLNFRK
jgi:hypothetical protein